MIAFVNSFTFDVPLTFASTFTSLPSVFSIDWSNSTTSSLPEVLAFISTSLPSVFSIVWPNSTTSSLPEALAFISISLPSILSIASCSPLNKPPNKSPAAPIADCIPSSNFLGIDIPNSNILLGISLNIFSILSPISMFWNKFDSVSFISDILLVIPSFISENLLVIPSFIPEIFSVIPSFIPENLFTTWSFTFENPSASLLPTSVASSATLVLIPSRPPIASLIEVILLTTVSNASDHLFLNKSKAPPKSP